MTDHFLEGKGASVDPRSATRAPPYRGAMAPMVSKPYVNQYKDLLRCFPADLNAGHMAYACMYRASTKRGVL